MPVPTILCECDGCSFKAVSSSEVRARVIAKRHHRRNNHAVRVVDSEGKTELFRVDPVDDRTRFQVRSYCEDSN